MSSILAWAAQAALTIHRPSPPATPRCSARRSSLPQVTKARAKTLSALLPQVATSSPLARTTNPRAALTRLTCIGGRTQMIANLLDGATPPSADITQNYVFCGLAETPDQVPDSVSGKIALIARGGSCQHSRRIADQRRHRPLLKQSGFRFRQGRDRRHHLQQR